MRGPLGPQALDLGIVRLGSGAFDQVPPDVVDAAWLVADGRGTDRSHGTAVAAGRHASTVGWRGLPP